MAARRQLRSAVSGPSPTLGAAHAYRNVRPLGQARWRVIKDKLERFVGGPKRPTVEDNLKLAGPAKC